MQDALVRRQVRDVVAPFSPLWRERFAALNRTPESVRTVADLATLPALGERDVSPDGDPAGMAALVLRGDEAGFVQHAEGARLRRALWLRATRPDAYRRAIDADTRPTSYVFSGLGFRYPLASTRSDLDVMARAGARLWSVLGLARDDVLVSAQPPAATTSHVALEYAALAAGAPALFPGFDIDAIAATIRMAPPTVFAVPAARAGDIVAATGPLPTVRTLLLLGFPTPTQRAAATAALRDAGAPDSAAVLAVHAPVGARLLWGECRQAGAPAGLHTYRDLEVAQVVDPDTGESEPAAAGPLGGELALTQLGMRGSALLRWRTGDLVAGIQTEPCPGCGRTVPRVQLSRPGGLVVRAETSGRATVALDLRAVAGTLLARDDLTDWRVVLGPANRDGRVAVVVHVVPRHRSRRVTAAVRDEVTAVAGASPTNVVVTDDVDLAALPGTPISAHLLVSE